MVGLDPDLIIEKYSAINSIEDSPPIVNDSVDQISKYVLTPKIILIAIFVILISFGVLATVFGIFGNNETVVIKMETEAESQESLLISTSNEFFTEENLMNLTIAYSDLCWTEIFDANGERLFFGLGDQDREVNIDGVPPFDVMLGAADNLLEIKLEGREYNVVDSIRRGEVLRFKVVDDQI